MAFVSRKKPWKFQVAFQIDELTQIPIVTGVLYCKVRLLDGSFKGESSREGIQEHTVSWKKTFQFECRMSVDPLSGLLCDSICRVSVRKETEGGKSCVKLGFAEFNLAEFAGSGYTVRHSLLEKYDNMSSKSDNSILKVTISMRLLTGDPCFRMPPSRAQSTAIPNEEDIRASRSRTSADSHSRTSADSHSSSASDLCSIFVCPLPFEMSTQEEYIDRVGDTRVDASDVVEKVLQEQEFTRNLLDTDSEEGGLALFVDQDGRAALGSRSQRYADDLFEQGVIKR